MGGVGITAADFERKMKKFEREKVQICVPKDEKEMLSDISTILKQFGYEAGANILERVYVSNGER